MQVRGQESELAPRGPRSCWTGPVLGPRSVGEAVGTALLLFPLAKPHAGRGKAKICVFVSAPVVHVHSVFEPMAEDSWKYV